VSRRYSCCTTPRRAAQRHLYVEAAELAGKAVYWLNEQTPPSKGHQFGIPADLLPSIPAVLIGPNADPRSTAHVIARLRMEGVQALLEALVVQGEEEGQLRQSTGLLPTVSRPVILERRRSSERRH
jgi:hypothetical protein